MSFDLDQMPDDNQRQVNVEVLADVARGCDCRPEVLVLGPMLLGAEITVIHEPGCRLYEEDVR